MMDQKLRNAGASGTGDLQKEINELKARLNAIEGRESSGLDIIGFFQDKAVLDIFSRSNKSNPLNRENSSEYWPDVYARVSFKLGRYGLNGYEFSINENLGGFSAWATKYFAPAIWMKLDGSLGQGRVIDPYDLHVIETPDTALGMTLGLWGMELGIRHGIVDTYDTETAYDFDGDSKPDDRFVDKTTARAQYTIPIQIPLLNVGTVEYAVENYYTEPRNYSTDPEKYFSQDVRTLRYLTRVRFDINREENRFLQTRAIKEDREADMSFYRGVNRFDLNQSQYYEILFNLGDLFKRGTNVTIMGAQKDLYFGSNELGEDLAGINLMGYSAGDYLVGRMPTADMVLEYGIKITQELYRSEWLLTGIFIRGEARPDKAISNYEEDAYQDDYYIYEQHVIRVDWRPRPNSSVYLAHEQTDLIDSSLSGRSQYFLVTNKIGMRFAF